MVNNSNFFKYVLKVVKFFFEHKKPLSMNVTRKRLCMIHLQRMIFKNEKLRFAILDGISFIFLLYQLFKLTKHISNSPSFCWLHGFNPWTQVYLIGKPSSCHFLFVWHTYSRRKYSSSSVQKLKNANIFLVSNGTRFLKWSLFKFDLQGHVSLLLLHYLGKLELRVYTITI